MTDITDAESIGDVITLATDVIRSCGTQESRHATRVNPARAARLLAEAGLLTVPVLTVDREAIVAKVNEGLADFVAWLDEDKTNLILFEHLYPALMHRFRATISAALARVTGTPPAEAPLRGDNPGHDLDLLKDACRYAVTSRGITAERVQRNVRVGAAKARVLVFLMASWGVVDPVWSGGKAHPVLVTKDDLPALFERMDAASKEAHCG